MGTSSTRTASTTLFLGPHNYALDADQVADLYRNGVAESDRDGSMTPIYESDFSAGLDGFSSSGGTVNVTCTGDIDTDADGVGIPPSNDWIRSLALADKDSLRIYRNYSGLLSKGYFSIEGYVYIPPALTVSKIQNSYTTGGVQDIQNAQSGLNYFKHTFEPSANVLAIAVSGTFLNGDAVYFKDIKLTKLGTTLRLEPENIQLSPGQWLDAANNHHAKLPAEGATLTRPQSDGIIKWTNTWAGTSEGQYICGINENIFPAENIRIEWISIQTDTTGVNITIGDQTDIDRYVESVALSDELDISSPANRNHDGTNRKLVITPSGTYTGSITTTIKYKLIG